MDEEEDDIERPTKLLPNRRADEHKMMTRWVLTLNLRRKKQEAMMAEREHGKGSDQHKA